MMQQEKEKSKAEETIHCRPITAYVMAGIFFILAIIFSFLYFVVAIFFILIMLICL
jgi:hypothetical protein